MESSVAFPSSNKSESYFVVVLDNMIKPTIQVSIAQSENFCFHLKLEWNKSSIKTLNNKNGLETQRKREEKNM